MISIAVEGDLQLSGRVLHNRFFETNLPPSAQPWPTFEAAPLAGGETSQL
jgi:hypothetical protein